MSDAPALPDPDAVCDGGTLDCGSGLLLIIRNAMQPVPGGGVLEVRSQEPTVRDELPAWCRIVNHTMLGTTDGAHGYTHYFIRKRTDDPGDGELEDHLQRAQDYEWKVRARWTAGMRATVFARNHQFDVGQPASFDTDDKALSAVEYLLGALAGGLAVGLQWRCSQHNIQIFNLEVSLQAKADNILVFLGVQESGHPGLAWVRGRCFIDADADDDVLQQLWTQTVQRSPIANSLQRAVALDVTMRTS